MPHAGAWLALFAAAGAECAWLPWAALPGPDVRLNSVGYTLGQRKRATVVDSRIYHEPTTWKLHQCHYGVPASGDRRFRCLASDASVLNGSFVRMRESDNGRRAWTADFSQVTTPGSYIMSARRRSFGHTMWSNSFNVRL
ncbi:hypothetical protein T492DRAFT_877790 [Pavlovales sp. CCMP2436]|nr:hypothetical protein T492DRAFT_877790 [Pavlovales sp. CCMP2436]